MAKQPDIHTDPMTRQQYLVGENGELVPYTPGSGLPVPPEPEANTPTLPSLEDFQALTWQEQRAIAQDHGLGEKPEGRTWEEFTIENLYPSEKP